MFFWYLYQVLMFFLELDRCVHCLSLHGNKGRKFRWVCNDMSNWFSLNPEWINQTNCFCKLVQPNDATQQNNSFIEVNPQYSAEAHEDHYANTHTFVSGLRVESVNMSVNRGQINQSVNCLYWVSFKQNLSLLKHTDWIPAPLFIQHLRSHESGLHWLFPLRSISL